MTRKVEEPSVLLGGEGNDLISLLKTHPDLFGDDMNDLEPLRKWLDVWDRVCDAADPDDGPLPEWSEVREVVAPDFRPDSFPSAEFFSDYMKADLIYRVRDLLHEKSALTPPLQGETI